MEKAGGQALAIPVDVADHKAVEAAAHRVEEVLGPIDVWVNVAFASVFAPFADITAKEYKRVTEVSYLGFVYGTMSALKRMVPRDTGTIVQVGSALAYRGIPLQTAYCGSKHAIQGFHEALRCELLHQGSKVRVTMVQMPAVNTPQFDWVLSRLSRHAQPVPPIYQPETAAKAVLFAADHPRPTRILGGRFNHGHPGRQRRRAWRPGSLSGQNWIPGAADGPTAQGRRRSHQFAGARRSPRRLYGPWQLRPTGPRSQPAAVGVTSPPGGGCSRRHDVRPGDSGRRSFRHSDPFVVRDDRDRASIAVRRS